MELLVHMFSYFDHVERNFLWDGCEVGMRVIRIVGAGGNDSTLVKMIPH